jgi:hypothetical protein
MRVKGGLYSGWREADFVAEGLELADGSVSGLVQDQRCRAQGSLQVAIARSGSGGFDVSGGLIRAGADTGP